MVDHSDADPCESCGATGVRTTRNRFPEGTSLAVCSSCLRQLRRWWIEWANYIQPEQAERVVSRARERELRADGGTVPDDAEHYPDGFHSGDHHVLDDGADPDYVPVENRCVDCGEEAFDRCGNCGMPLCGRHNEVQAGFCSHFIETPYPVCVWGEDVYVFEGNAADHEVLVTDRTRSDVYHLSHAGKAGDDSGTAPLCRPIEDGKERVAMRDLDDDVELCGLCEGKLIALADDDGTEEGDA